MTSYPYFVANANGGDAAKDLGYTLIGSSTSIIKDLRPGDAV